MATKDYKPRPRTLSAVRDELDSARRALNNSRYPIGSLEHRVIAGAVRDLESEAATIEREAARIFITWDTDSDVLMLKAA